MIVKYAPTSSFFILTVEFLVSLARGGGEIERQKSNFVALKIRTIERETETKIKDRNRDRKRQKEIDKENETKAEKRLPSLT